MDILVDTHIFLWLACCPEKVESRHMRFIEDTTNRLFLSTMSIAEIAIKRSIGNLVFDADIFQLLEEMDIEPLDFDASSAWKLATLPLHHRDPFDRMIIAQAMTKHLKIITVDRKFRLYDCELI